MYVEDLKKDFYNVLIGKVMYFCILHIKNHNFDLKLY
jgi:hypothetical protein